MAMEQTGSDPGSVANELRISKVYGPAAISVTNITHA